MRLRQGPQAGERGGRIGLLEAPHGVGDLRGQVVRIELGRSGERGLGREGPAAPLEGRAVEEVRAHAAGPSAAPEGRELLFQRQVFELGRQRERGVEERPTRRHVGVEQILRTKSSRRIGIRAESLTPLSGRGPIVAGGVEGKTEVQANEARGRSALCECPELRHGPLGPGGDRRADGGLQRARVLREDGCEALASSRHVAAVVGALCCAEGTRLGVVPNRKAELEGRPAALGALLGRRFVRAAHERHTDDDAGSQETGRAGEQAYARARRHAPSLAASVRRIGIRVATFREVMPTYRELLEQTKREIHEVDASRARQLLEEDSAVAIDVREREEWDEGHLPAAVHVPRGHLESRIERASPDKARPLVVYCASGSRSAFAAKTLEELGYEHVLSLAGGFTDWKRNGLPFEIPAALDEQKRRRYSRHLLIPEVGEEGQLRLLESRILLIGAGGLGSPASLYLAAAGVGTLGIVDDDAVDETNLQRQIVHSTERLGDSKAESAKRTIEALNPDVTVKVFRERLTSENVDRILGEGWDVIVDGADNFPTRYLLNDASVWHRIPVVHGSIFRFEGQTTVFKPHEGPCYRCLFSQPPPPELAPSCAEGGVLGVLPGVIGSLQANEALKLALGIGDPLVGRLLMFDALEGTFTEIKLRRDPDCPVCGENPTITDYVDYVEFCQGGRTEVAS
jgi:sulfur-carrier protein adenylyltransferase/sulfurtransferase